MRKRERRTEAQSSQTMVRQNSGVLDRRNGDRRQPGKRREISGPVLYSVGAIASASEISSSIASAANAGSAACVIGLPTTK
jgi:hypothetical protein